MENDGFTLDDKRTQIGDGQGDIPDIIERFEKRKGEKNEDRKAKCFFVPIKEIREKNYDLSISTYRTFEHEEVKYEKPSVIKNKILSLEKDIIETLEDLDIEKG